MTPFNCAHWPPGLPRTLTAPVTTVCANLAISASRYPDKPALIFHETPMTYAEVKDQSDRLAGYLQRCCGVKKGDRVLLYMQNCPQFVVAYFAVARADAVVIPVNPMYRREEVGHVLEDTGARVIICAADRIEELNGSNVRWTHIVKVDYRDAMGSSTDLLSTERVESAPIPADPGVIKWLDALSAAIEPAPATAGPDDLCMLMYSSGTTGRPKGCIHTHGNMSGMAASVAAWMRVYADSVLLMTVPLFHIAGMQNMMHAPILVGATVVIAPRWNRDTACSLTERYRATHWTMMPSMIIDVLSDPNIDDYDLKSVQRIGGGGAAMPQAISEALEKKWGIRFLEGYGLTESGHALSNPPHLARRHCLGIPLFEIDVRIVDPDTLEGLTQGKHGEIVISSPFLFKGYWNNPGDTAKVLVNIDEKRFFRTGDIGYIDEDGYFFIVDRMKRMVNASGYKVWPAEVEAMLHDHPAVREACVISAADPQRGETVKAVIALKLGYVGTVSASDIIDWSKERMAAYKYPRLVEFVDSLPLTPTGKVDWRRLQEIERLPASVPPTSQEMK
jgi:fatty-acyl-CoA synthase